MYLDHDFQEYAPMGIYRLGKKLLDIFLKRLVYHLMLIETYHNLKGYLTTTLVVSSCISAHFCDVAYDL